MKLLVISDLHGSLTYLQHALEAFEREQCTHLLLLGDLLNHGPRNPLPSGYNPSEVATVLNGYADCIVAIRGNCDSEVDQMLFSFPMLADSTQFFLGERRVFATHGHLFSPDERPPLRAGDIFISGHIHLIVAESQEQVHILNPGSLSLPKNELPHTYATLDAQAFRVFDDTHQLVKTYTF